MKYLIIYTRPETGKREAFYTNWFSAENNFNADLDMIVIYLSKSLFMVDGKNWQDIEEDHL